MQFKTLFAVASFAAASVAQTFSMIQNDLSMKIAPEFIHLNATIHDFPILGGGTVEQAMAIHYSTIALIETANNTTSTINNMSSKFSDIEGMKVLSDLKTMQPMVTSSLTGIVARLPALRALPSGNATCVIKNDIRELKNCCDAFLKALNNHISPMILKEVEPVEAFANSTFDKVMRIY